MDVLLRIIDLLAVFAAAISGSLEGRSKQMDLIGVYFVALATALGGGTMRDLILNRHPIFWVTDARYPLYVLVFALMAILLVRRNRASDTRLLRTIDVADAIGLGLFSMVGASYALQAHCAPPVAVLIGMTNGIFGGILRDITCNEIPAVFRRNTQLYATCSFAGCVAYLLLMSAGLAQGTAFSVGIAVTFSIRLLAMRFNIGLPV